MPRGATSGPRRAGPRAGRLSRPSCRHLPARSTPLPADAHEEFLEVLPGPKRILVGEAPPVDDADGVRHLLHLGEDVARDDHRRTRRREAADLVAQLLDADGVEAVGGLVEHEQAWPGDQRQREPQALPHAHREAPGALLPGVREVHGGEHLIYAALGKAQQRGAHAQVLARGEVGVERRLLDEAADCVEVLAAPGVPGKEDLPGRRPQHPADHLERSRLAGAVGTEQPVHLALADMKTHVGHGVLRLVAAAEALGEPARLEHVTHGFILSLPDARAESPCPRALPFGFTSMVGRVSNEAITAVGLFWRQPFSTRTPLMVCLS